MKDDYHHVNDIDTINKARVTSKIKNIRSSYKKAFDLGKRSGGGRIVMIFYDLCNEIWNGSPATTSSAGGADTSSTANGLDNTTIDEDKEKSQVVPVNNDSGDRRNQIAKFLKEERHKRMSKKRSFEQQQAAFYQEDLSLKKQLIDKMDAADKEFNNNMAKITRSMETVSSALVQSMNLMTQLIQQQPPQQFQWNTQPL